MCILCVSVCVFAYGVHGRTWAHFDSCHIWFFWLCLDNVCCLPLLRLLRRRCRHRLRQHCIVSTDLSLSLPYHRAVFFFYCIFFLRFCRKITHTLNHQKISATCTTWNTRCFFPTFIRSFVRSFQSVPVKSVFCQKLKRSEIKTKTNIVRIFVYSFVLGCFVRRLFEFFVRLSMLL